MIRSGINIRPRAAVLAARRDAAANKKETGRNIRS